MEKKSNIWHIAYQVTEPLHFILSIHLLSILISSCFFLLLLELSFIPLHLFA